MEEMQKELNELKALISKLPVLASLELGKTLLYIAVTIHVISTTLVVEREEPGQVYKVQRPVNYISKVLSDCETCYNWVQKLIYIILIMKVNLYHFNHETQACTLF
jgi:hypothetical protein